jgi:hypothetical protein
MARILSNSNIFQSCGEGVGAQEKSGIRAARAHLYTPGEPLGSSGCQLKYRSFGLEISWLTTTYTKL